MFFPRCHRFAALLLLTATATIGSVRGQQAGITTRTDAVGRLLNAWGAEKSAAGLSLITYENRDGQHSLLNAAQYPQLKIYQPAEQEKAAGRDKGLASVVRVEPTVGNCSMAAHPTSGGSLPRIYYSDPTGLLFVNQQYLSNNLFVYPEHLDHDLGGNGIGGWGDLYPANSACLIISQGSSFSDMPFVNAVLSTIAAFDPDVLTTLIRKRMLMPTVQAIFRQSNKMVKSEADYFTAKSHPVVFDGAQLNEEKMILTAHTMTRAAIPPVVILSAVSESEATPGRHFFEKPGVAGEKLGDAPTVIARVFRSHESERQIVVSTRGSGDLLGRPVSLTWQILRGDPKLIRLEEGPEKGQATIRLKWHMPMITETGIRTNRVDIGVFATNGVSTSAPAFVTFYMLPNENRFYDDKGRVSEIYYEAANPDLGLPPAAGDLRWIEVFKAMAMKGDGLRSGLTEQAFNRVTREAVEGLWQKFQPRARALQTLEQDEQKKEDAAGFRASLEKDLAEALSQPVAAGASQPLRQTIERGFDAIAAHWELFLTFQREIEKLAASSPKSSAPGDLAREVKRLIELGILIQEASGIVSTVHATAELTAGERHQLRGLNLLILGQVLFPEALERSSAAAYVDPRLSTPKAWRDVFRYDAKGDPDGWVRYFRGRTYRFDADGQLHGGVAGAPDKRVSVDYKAEGDRLVFSPK